MRCQVIVHDPGSEAGMIGDALVEHGYRLERLEVTVGGSTHSDVPFGDPADYDLILPMGSYRSLYDPAIGSWIGRELDHLRAADAAGVPVLGICFGGQALAAAHGGRVVAADRDQIGWYPLRPGPDTGLPPGPWMQWHGDRFDAPPDATVLAEDDHCTQAFRLRRNLGLQFHPEVDRPHLQGWLDEGGYEVLAGKGLDAAMLLATTDHHTDDARRRGRDLVRFFLDDVATA